MGVSHAVSSGPDSGVWRGFATGHDRRCRGPRVQRLRIVTCRSASVVGGMFPLRERIISFSHRRSADAPGQDPSFECEPPRADGGSGVPAGLGARSGPRKYPDDVHRPHRARPPSARAVRDAYLTTEISRGEGALPGVRSRRVPAGPATTRPSGPIVRLTGRIDDRAWPPCRAGGEPRGR